MRDCNVILTSIPLLFTGLGAILGKLSTQVREECLYIDAMMLFFQISKNRTKILVWLKTWAFNWCRQFGACSRLCWTCLPGPFLPVVVARCRCTLLLPVLVARCCCPLSLHAVVARSCPFVACNLNLQGTLLETLAGSGNNITVIVSATGGTASATGGTSTSTGTSSMITR